MKFPHVVYMTLHIIWEKTFDFAWSALEFVEFDGIKECVQKAILERNFTKESQFHTTGLAHAQRWR